MKVVDDAPYLCLIPRNSIRISPICFHPDYVACTALVVADRGLDPGGSAVCGMKPELDPTGARA